MENKSVVSEQNFTEGKALHYRCSFMCKIEFHD